MSGHIAGLAVDKDDMAGLPLHGVRPDGLADMLREWPAAAPAAQLQNFTAATGQILLLADATGNASRALVGLGDDPALRGFGAAAFGLPAGSVWNIAPGNYAPEDAALGFLLGAYRFDRLRHKKATPALLAPANVPERAAVLAGAAMLARDLINTPANLLGPAELAEAAMQLAARHGAQAERIRGDALNARYPAVAAVGAGSSRAPEVVVLHWQGSGADKTAPLVSLCGKGVCFDTGGYDLKPSSAMLRMKKDMGGAAILLGVAEAIMLLNLPLRLELRIGCVENSISGHAMRPSDVIRTRSGLSVEIGNTDAEGRLVLCDLLAEAAEASPHWLINAATLTGAARVALGPDLPALFCNDDKMANILLHSGQAATDPFWRLPLHEGYASWLDSPVADLCNVSSKPHAGAITAALFLQRFVPRHISWAHIDVYAWNDSSRPGRPEGGEAQTLRALVAALETLSNAGF
ncbi:MAG TPA: leucyl aminopeptidase family protein [Acidocella sp.]|nr:leucyl aminopeptidase family protein [Acidocella sp.]